MKVKGTRLPNDKVSDELAEAAPLVKAFLRNPDHPVVNRGQFVNRAPIDWDDHSVELVPQVYLDQSKPKKENVFDTLEEELRNLLAYLIKIRRVKLDQSTSNELPSNMKRVQWRAFPITQLFELKRGHFHSIADLDAGDTPTIARVGTDNGLVGFYVPPEGAKVFPARTITVSSVTGDAVFQPVPFIATDNVVVCPLRRKYLEVT